MGAGEIEERSRALEAAAQRTTELEARLAESAEPDREFLAQRIASLRTWHRKALRFLPLLQTFLGKGRSE